MPKKYQRLEEDPDSESEPEQATTEPVGKYVELDGTDIQETEKPVKEKPAKKRPGRVPGQTIVKYIEPDAVKQAISENKIQLTKKQQRQLIGSTRVISDERREKLKEWAAQGREKAAANRQRLKEQKLIEEQEKQKLLIKVEKAPRKKHKKKLQAVNPTAVNQEDTLYPDEDTEAETTDTRTIRKTQEKLKLIRSTTQAPPPKREYRELSILEKLNSKY